MTDKPVVHATFTIERRYAASPDRVFAAFSDPAKKQQWLLHGKGFATNQFTADFRVGGFEKSRFTFGGSVPGGPPAGTLMGNDTVYVDIKPNRRLVFAYAMLVGDRRMSASLATVELFPADGGGTRLVFTEQSAFFEPADGAQLREAGWRELLAKVNDVVSGS